MQHNSANVSASSPINSSVQSLSSKVEDVPPGGRPAPPPRPSLLQKFSEFVNPLVVVEMLSRACLLGFVIYFFAVGAPITGYILIGYLAGIFLPRPTVLISNPRSELNSQPQP